jgi:molecular chaperone DnaK (HSP70)
VSVPAYYSSRNRKALLDALEMIGLSRDSVKLIDDVKSS